MSRFKISRNAPCPCGRLKKFKHCCYNKVNWEALLLGEEEGFAQNLTVRGKNVEFFIRALISLEIDPSGKNVTSIGELKKKITPDAVREIYHSIEMLWPDLRDFETATSPVEGEVKAFYTGSYEPAAIKAAIAKLSLYCDKILLVDPFMRPSLAQDQFNPLENPEQHRANVLKFIQIWGELWPWINAGIVEFVRPVHDFIPGLWGKILDVQRSRIDNNAELKDILEADTKEEMKESEELKAFFADTTLLFGTREKLIEDYKEMTDHTGSDPFGSEDEYLKFIDLKRESSPYYFGNTCDTPNKMFYHQTSGSCYELAKRMCQITNSHIATNMKFRWKEVELDHTTSGIDNECWSPFAKALQDSGLKAINKTAPDLSLKIREEKRLESMRNFLRRVWRAAGNPEQFSASVSADFTSELEHEIALANAEWRDIDRSLLKWFGPPASLAIVTASTGMLPATGALTTAVAGGAFSLINSRMQRASFKDTHPAGFFMS